MTEQHSHSDVGAIRIVDPGTDGIVELKKSLLIEEHDQGGGEHFCDASDVKTVSKHKRLISGWVGRTRDRRDGCCGFSLQDCSCQPRDLHSPRLCIRVAQLRKCRD